MKLIGLLGGMSWQSTIGYYRLANELVAHRLGGYHSARLLLHSVDFAEIQRMQVEERWEDAGRLLAQHARELEVAGAEVILIGANTMHKVAGQIEEGLGVPLLHIADVTAAAVRRDGVTSVGLLGTAYTMEQPFLRERLAAGGLDVLVPSAEERAVVHQVIYQELVNGVVTADSRAQFQEIIANLVTAGAQGVILGCTEIELLISQPDSPVPVYPTTRLHVEAAVDFALATPD